MLCLAQCHLVGHFLPRTVRPSLVLTVTPRLRSQILCLVHARDCLKGLGPDWFLVPLPAWPLECTHLDYTVIAVYPSQTAYSTLLLLHERPVFLDISFVFTSSPLPFPSRPSAKPNLWHTHTGLQQCWFLAQRSGDITSPTRIFTPLVPHTLSLLFTFRPSHLAAVSCGWKAG